MQRILRYGFWFAVIIGLGNIVRLALSPSTARASESIISPIPYTTTLMETTKTPSGKVGAASNSFYTYAVRGDGSTVFKFQGKDGTVIRIVKFISGDQVEVRDLIEMKSSTAGRPGTFLRDPKAKCSASPPVSGEVATGENIIGSYRVAEVKKGGRTSSYALEYGCALVREQMGFENGAISEKEAVAVVAGEPDPTLFYVPVSFKEVPPSELVGNGNATAEIKASFRNRDEMYFKHRPSSAMALKQQATAPSCSGCGQNK